MFSTSGHPTSWCDLGRGKRTGQEDVSTAAKVWVGHVVERPLQPMPPAAPSPHHQAPPPLFLAPKHALREHIPNYLVEAVGRKRGGALGGVEGWVGEARGGGGGCFCQTLLATHCLFASPRCPAHHHPHLLQLPIWLLDRLRSVPNFYASGGVEFLELGSFGKHVRALS